MLSARRALGLGLATAGWATCACLLLRMAAIGTARLDFEVAGSLLSLGPACDDALAAPCAAAGGVPWTGIGLVWFAGVVLLLAVGKPAAVRAAWIGAAAGAGPSSALLVGMLLYRDAMCLPGLFACAAGVMLSIVMPCGLAGLAPTTRRLVAVSAVMLVAATAGLTATTWVGARADRDAAVAEHLLRPSFEIPFEPSDPIVGQPNGRARIVVFASFECPWCAEFTRVVRHLQNRFGGDLTVVFKHFPQADGCSPPVLAVPQPRTCVAAWAAEAANLQHAFWPYLDVLLSVAPPHGEDVLQAAARQAGLDVAAWEDARRSAAVFRKVRADVNLGLRVGVRSTPAVFLNGRPVPNPSLNLLASLIARHLGRTP